MDQTAKSQLLSGDALGTLEHSLRARIPPRAAPQGSLAVRVGETGVFISDDWVVSIHGRRLIQCVSAMLVLLDWIGQQLEATVEVRLSGLQNGKNEQLESAVSRGEKCERWIAMAKWSVTILASVGLGALIQWLVCNGVLP